MVVLAAPWLARGFLLRLGLSGCGDGRSNDQIRLLSNHRGRLARERDRDASVFSGICADKDRLVIADAEKSRTSFSGMTGTITSLGSSIGDSRPHVGFVAQARGTYGIVRGPPQACSRRGHGLDSGGVVF